MDESSPPVSFDRVLDAEHRALHDGASPLPEGETDARAAVHALQRAALEEGHSALCLSGGGIRSASFGIGVLQGFARLGLLDRFDYLSTVSGGGYAGGWLSAWRARAADPAAVTRALAGDDLPRTRHEPRPLIEVRRLAKFLDPRVGALSADVWTLLVTIFRNLLLNWLVLLPLLAAALLVPRLYLSMLDLPSQAELVGPRGLETATSLFWITGLVALLAVMTYITMDLPSLGGRGWPQRRFLTWFLVPAIVAHASLSVSAVWQWLSTCTHRPLMATAGASCAALLVPGLAGLVLGARGWRPWTWVGAAVAGLLGGTTLWLAKTHWLLPSAPLVAGLGCADALAVSSETMPLYAALDLPVSLGILALELALLVGLSGTAMSDDDREWWARTGAWLVIVVVCWLAVAGVVLLAHDAIERTLHDLAGLSLSAPGVRSTLALVTFLLGSLATRSGRRASTGKVPSAIFGLAAPTFAALLLVLLASINLDLLGWIETFDLVHGEHVHPAGGGLLEVLLLMTVLIAIGLVAGWRVSVNQFSLFGMYRARLVRSFVGASRPAAERHPHGFTGFDPDDDVALVGLASAGRPLHIVNATLNLVQGSRRLGQERQAAAFTFSRLHAGSREVGYRDSERYAGGLTLGDAITISGAAVSPQMGSETSAALTFLLTLFNARLGVWLGNPGEGGAHVWRRRDPGLGPSRILGEMLGQTSTENPYVYLSDGGHFENLGLYEMVVRHCRTIIVSDAGCDPAYACSDLGNAVRRVRLDLGIPIEFSRPPAMSVVGVGNGNPHCTVGRIRYSAVDPASPDGMLVVLKATLSGDEPVDVLDYWRAHPEFPHEPTSNQWFADAQFESYRALGFHTALAVASGMTPEDGVDGFCRCAERHQVPSGASSDRAAERSPVSNPSVNLK